MCKFKFKFKGDMRWLKKWNQIQIKNEIFSNRNTNGKKELREQRSSLDIVPDG
jgi:hypothetical protein